MKSFWTSPAFPDKYRARNTNRRCRRRWQALVLFVLAASQPWAPGADSKPLLFLADQDYPPMTYLEEGVAKGMDVDFSKALARQMKREIRIELTDWSLAQERLSRGEADGLIGMSISEERRKQFDFSHPMFTREYGLLVRSGEMTIREASDLKAKNVGVTPGGFPKRFLETHPGINLILITNYQDGFARLTSRTIDALAADLWVAAFLIEKQRVKGVTLSGKPFATAEAAMAVQKGNTALLAEINRAIRALQANGSLAAIRESWRPQEMLFVSRERMRGMIARVLGGGLVILVGGLIFWIITLKRQVRIRKQAESALRESEGRFQLAVRGSTDGLWDWNIQTNAVFHSDRLRELLGYSLEEFPHEFRSFEARLHPDEKDWVLRQIAAHLEQRSPYDVEYRLRTKSGEYRWFRARGQAIWDEQGRATRMAGSITDITEHRLAEESVRRNEELFRAIVEDQTEMIVRWKPDGTRTFVNDAYCRVFGGTREQFVGTSFFPLISASDRDAVLARIRTLTPASPVSTEIHRSLAPGGELLWQEWTDRAIFDARGQMIELQSTGRDITARKRAEGMTDAQRQVLEMIAAGRPLIATLDALLRLIESQSADMLCSILLLEADGQHVRHAAAPSLPAEYLKAIDGSSIGPQAGSCGTAAFRREPVFVADIANDPLWAAYRHLALPHGLRACWSTPIFDEQRNLLGTFAIYHREPRLPGEQHQRLITMATYTAAVCITKQRTDQALRESEEKFSKAFRTSPDSISISGLDTGCYIEVNDGFCKHYGYAREAVIGHNPLELGIWRPEQRESYVTLLRQHGSVRDYELHTHSRDGRALVTLVSAELIELDGQVCVVAVGHDITDRQRAEREREEAQARERHTREEFTRQLLTAQERERKRLASELHDSLGQNLSIIKNRLHFARQIPGTSTDVLAHLDAIERVAAGAITETRNLARNLRPLHIEQVGLTDSLKGLIQEVSQSTDIRFERRVEQLDDVLRGEAATHIYRIVQEALNNLVKHSRATVAGVTIERDVRSVRLRILDDGVGFDPRQRRVTGGLGLTSLDERARMLGGSMVIESAPGKGTRLEFQIPISDAGDESGSAMVPS